MGFGTGFLMIAFAAYPSNINDIPKIMNTSILPNSESSWLISMLKNRK
jgi:hypothetical protein